jgi:hypothetical protein
MEFLCPRSAVSAVALVLSGVAVFTFNAALFMH